MGIEYEQINYHSKTLPIQWIVHDIETARPYAPPHWHEALEVSFTVSGIIEQFNIEFQDYRTEPGDILLINSTEIHQFKTTITEDSKALTIFIPYDLLASLIPNFEYQRFYCHPTDGTFDRQKVKELQRILYAIFYSIENAYSELEQINLLSLTYQLIYQLTDKWMYQVEDSNRALADVKGRKRLAPIITYIQEHFNLDLSLNQIATEFKLSPYYLSKLFKKELGITVMTYVQLVRTQEAQKLMLFTDKPIYIISDLVGFKNEKSFRKNFVETFGITPKQYQLQQQNKNRIIKE
ncbi:helix-turn-helix transcriptional regulator [Bacillus toyonensis]|uniref:helix-turn-helix transcriptional regulator n=1 Tax=Bacillus toyonensis TaxID=155322 RepID=UPI00253F73F6|nr:AraC family transcriptional regulator [Bacillus toyonensis]WIG34038.1 AraC family transcriptional regulator [Bacillus toyonensis]